ncbi:MAG: hypothetical protein HZB47_11465 [Nitrosomonadales bacterium]|nr:hypothetical protein [Nitrosomonadales bacterium]
MKSLLKELYRFLMRCIPNGRRFDNFVAFISFLRMHKRLPGNKLLFNDVLYRIKTTDEIIDPLRVFVSDKEFVKLYVKAVAGDQYNVPTLKVLHTIEEAREFQFPADCCIKPTHMSGKVILRRQNSPIDFEEVDNWFNTAYYNRTSRELNYKTLKPKVIVEPLVFNSANPTDFKIFCYQGKPKLIQIDLDRYIEHTEKFFDPEWNEMPFSIHFPRSRKAIEKPGNLDNMLELAGLLSRHFTFVRVDLYSNGTECLVGEITNCPGGATGFVTNMYSNGAKYLREEMTYPAAEPIASKMIFGTE